MHLELPITSFVCAALALVPLPWHWRAGTVPTISISVWLFIANIISAVNATIWSGNVRIVAPVWCDIATKLTIGMNIALPSSIFALCVHLERVSAIRQTSTSCAVKRRRQVLDGLWCVGVPVVYMALHYIVQGHRFDIIEDFGCRASIYVSLPAVFLIWVPPLLFCLGAMILSGLAFRNFWRRRLAFARHLQSSNSALTPSRYFRLMSMSLFQMFWGLGIYVFNMWFTLEPGLRPWTGWADVHYGFSRIGLFPAMLIPSRIWVFTYIIWWSIPISTIIFFAFFGFGQDAMKEYRSFISWLVQKIIPRSASSKPSTQLLISLDGKKARLPAIKTDASVSSSSEAYTMSPTASTFSIYDKSMIPTPSSTSTFTLSSPRLHNDRTAHLV